MCEWLTVTQNRDSCETTACLPSPQKPSAPPPKKPSAPPRTILLERYILLFLHSLIQFEDVSQFNPYARPCGASRTLALRLSSRFPERETAGLLATDGFSVEWQDEKSTGRPVACKRVSGDRGWSTSLSRVCDQYNNNSFNNIAQHASRPMIAWPSE
ncbi:hypothetical protein BCR34DRAFT_378805 [Clohesyomyces aquaticus]|uniref:Uncharacterized protein n=1 Tax=Clohesyomyces aquaticus TaxID=1231657 RepID=A0A1Y2A671_9PLEO|nr:hypothetical protein BCR34DRAFT_378805 [Clohesyomyces aquaticus]